MSKVLKIESDMSPEMNKRLALLLNYIYEEQVKNSGLTEEQYEAEKFREFINGYLVTGEYRNVYKDEDGNIVTEFKEIVK